MAGEDTLQGVGMGSENPAETIDPSFVRKTMRRDVLRHRLPRLMRGSICSPLRCRSVLHQEDNAKAWAEGTEHLINCK